MLETIEAPSHRNSGTDGYIHAMDSKQGQSPPPWIAYCGYRGSNNRGPGIISVDCPDCLMVLRSKGFQV